VLLSALLQFVLLDLIIVDAMGNAFNMNCPDSVVNAFQLSLAKVMKTPRFRAILDSYLK
jgi:hypothetical protein